MIIMRRAPKTTPKARTCANPVTPATNSATDDPFFLCWGSSVNVNEDLRRTIRSEVEDINASIEDLETKLGGAERISTQLERDLKHARSEMYSLTQSMADDLDVSKVNLQVRNRLGETLQKSLVAAVASPVKENEENSKDNEEKDSMDVEGGDTSTRNTNHKSYLTSMSDQRNQLMLRMQELRGSLEQTNTGIQGIQEEEAILQERIAAEGLEALVDSAAKEEETEIKDKEHEQQGMRTKKEAIQYCRARGGDHAQQIANLAKLLRANKTNHENAKSELGQEMESKLRENRDLEQQSEVSSELELVSGQLARLQQELELAASIREARSAKKRERESLVASHDALVHQDKELKDKVDASKVKLDATLASLKKAQEEAASVEAIKVKNDEWEATNQGTGQAELAELLKEKENLASAMNTLHQTTVKAADKNKKALEEQQTLLATVQGELQQTQKELEAVSGNKVKTLDDVAQAEKACKDEIKELEDLASNLELAISAEQVRKDELEKQKMEERQEQILEIQNESGKVRAKLEVIREVLLYGKELIECTHETEDHLNDAPLEPSLADESEE